MDITKQSQVAASGTNGGPDGGHSGPGTEKLTPEEVYVFSVRLCRRSGGPGF